MTYSFPLTFPLSKVTSYMHTPDRCLWIAEATRTLPPVTAIGRDSIRPLLPRTGTIGRRRLQRAVQVRFLDHEVAIRIGTSRAPERRAHRVGGIVLRELQDAADVTHGPQLLLGEQTLKEYLPARKRRWKASISTTRVCGVSLRNPS